MVLEPGTILNNRYRIISVLGQGGMGAVYRAVDERLGSPVAVKENLNLADEFARQFKKEAVTLASLRHPALPRVADYFAYPRQGQYLVMDYIEGEDLRQRIERMDHLPDRDVVLIGEAVCDALTYLHTRIPPVIHRDIKPGNIKITPSQKVFLVDFGLVKQEYADQATTTGARAMTPGYSPPEQYGTARTDARTDVYSLAATLYAALTGAIPEDSITRATHNVALTPIPTFVPNCSKHLAVVIEKGLELNPNDRYQTAAEFRRALLDSLELTTSFLTPPRITAPPPEAVDSIPSSQNYEEIFTPPEEEEEVVEPAPIELPPSTRQKPARSKSRVLLISAVVLVMLVLGSFFVPWTNLPSFIRPTPIPVVQKTSTSIPSLTRTSAPVLLPEENQTIQPTEMAVQPTVENSPTMTITEAPSPTATPLISIIGGSDLIAFTSERTGNSQIWSMNPDGSTQKQMTGLADGACQPAWSPDGTQLAFISPCIGKKDIYAGSQIYLSNADGKNVHLMPAPMNPAGDFNPAWSPDGKKIAFASLRTDTKPHIFLFSFEDSSVKQVTSASYGDIQPSWAPSGLQLAFVRQFPNSQIWITDLTGKQQFQYSPSGAVKNYWPEWSRDGSILFYSQTSPEPFLPYLVGLSYENRGKSLEFRLPPVGAADIGPATELAISPDGKWGTYESWPDGTNHDIYIISIDGSDRRRLTTDKERDFSPVWKPISTSIP
ncbi:MAG: protein kinase [Leptolinea sp.]|jgi:serine/threonine protein kinase|nr:protein kinase [Leptolinea sp.]